MDKIIDLLQRLVECFFYFVQYPNPTLKQLNNVKIVAHRGWHDNIDIIENTMPSFKKAFDNKIFGVELDIRWTKDLVPIVHHDSDLSRLWNSEQEICHLNFSDLRIQFPEIPSLSEVVGLYGKKIHFFIELKEEYYPNSNLQKNILKETLQAIEPGIDFHFLCLSSGPLEVFDIFSKEVCIMVAGTNINEVNINVAIKNQFFVNGMLIEGNDEKMLGWYSKSYDKIQRSKMFMFTKKINKEISFITEIKINA